MTWSEAIAVLAVFFVGFVLVRELILPLTLGLFGRRGD